MAAAADSLMYPYKPLYSSSFSIGQGANAKIVLDIWRAYEDNRLSDTKAWWADFVGRPGHEGDLALEEVTALRDLLMNYPKAADMPDKRIPLDKLKVPPGGILVLVEDVKGALNQFPKLVVLTPEKYQERVKQYYEELVK